MMKIYTPQEQNTKTNSEAFRLSFSEKSFDWSTCLKAFAVDDGWTRFVVFLFRDPHLLEGGQRRQDRTSDPDGVFALRWSDDLDLHRGRGQRCDFFLHAVSDAWVHGGTTRQHGVGVQVLADIDVTLHDRVVGRLVDTSGFHAEEARLEQSFGASESFVADGDDLTIGQFVTLLQR